ncbi:hypothetical protein HD806DRAFT_542273 [Xylariaceae sp. AK1471]|nr:hypothetical protein HD806DRAFT_542273 [Xylariaceae sp. AK1471]
MAEVEPANKLTIRLDGPDKPVWIDTLAKISDFIRCSKIGIDDHDIKDSTDLLPAQSPLDLQPVVLPVEIILHIFQYLNEPCKLFGQIVPKGDDSDLKDDWDRDKQIIFNRPRLWASMPTFQICQATRSMAIKRYGEPMLNSLSFDPSVDIISLRVGNRGDAELELLDSNTDSSKWVWASPIVYCNAKHVAYATAPPKQLKHKFLARIHDVEIEAGGGFCFETEDWYHTAELLVTHFTNMRQLKINLWQHVACGGTQVWYHNDSSVGTGYYNYHDADLVSGIVDYMTEHGPLYPSLEVLEIEKTKA